MKFIVKKNRNKVVGYCLACSCNGYCSGQCTGQCTNKCGNKGSNSSSCNSKVYIC